MQVNRLDDWLADESRLAQTSSDKTAAAIDPTHISGLELLQGALDGPGLNASIGRTLDFRLVEVSHGRAVSRARRRATTTTRWARSTAAGSPPCSIWPSAVRCTARSIRASPTPRWS